MLDFLRRIVSLCRKELLAILKDPANRVILVVSVSGGEFFIRLCRHV